MNYQQEKQAYDDQVKRFQKIESLDQGPGNGTPVKVAAVYMLKYDDNFMGYHNKSCLAAGPFEANFDDRIVINGRLGDYELYLLDKSLDPDQRIVIVQRDTTARIIKDFRVELTFNYDCTPLNVKKLAAGLATLVLDDDTTVDEALIALINPKEDDQVKRLQKALDEGPYKGTPVKVQGVYTLAYDKVSRAYNVDSCLSAGPFEANFDDIITINEQFGDYTIYLLDEEIDPEQRIIIIQRGETARILSDYGETYLTHIISDYGVVYSVDTPIATRNMAARLAFFVQKNKRMSDNDRVERLRDIEILGEGTGEGTPSKVAAVYTLTYNDNFRAYRVKNCLSAEPFEVNFDHRISISRQVDDYEIYLLDKDLDPEQKIIIVQRGTTARIIKGFMVELTFDYNCTSETTRNLAATLAILILDDDTTVDKALVDLLHPRKDETKSDF